jgi:activator of 2-hydroxyglutaryl-CoA dehydratase/predicted nucleotide-binding protein (sugar kinase/HSP70/actin superfamily)
MDQKATFQSSVETGTHPFSLQRQKNGFHSLFIDAGIKNLRLRAIDPDGALLSDIVIPSNSDLNRLISQHQGEWNITLGEDARVFLTGKLAAAVKDSLGCGKIILPAAVFWLAAKDLVNLPENSAMDSLAMIDLSASGYLLIGIDRTGDLKHDLLLTNPHCGAGSGINLDRVLQKLAVAHDEVDGLLAGYLGDEGLKQRQKVLVRADRCGVFASSATISDKNQGIPLDVALATTLKSEVHKVCKKLPKGFQKVYLTGRIFRWQYMRDCARDLLETLGVQEIEFDCENTRVLEAMHALVERIGPDKLLQPDDRLVPQSTPEEYPPFYQLKSRYEANGHYLRLPDDPVHPDAASILKHHPVIIGLDVGSSMAKVVVADSTTGNIAFQAAYSNAGDTIETIKLVFKNLLDTGIKQLQIAGIGITGSARYQVQQALLHIYPALNNRISVLVENYAHARGSIEHARRHIQKLKEQGISEVNEDFCILIDIGGEDTKISTIALKQAELFDNAMNLKCSAGTGSLMDTLTAMFNIGSVAQACEEAYAAPRSFAINATCAVFLMENASKLQAQGVPQGQILASANWAIVENMARTLWNQLDLPGNTVTLLHGQTMLSEPLPLAVTHRLHSYLGSSFYALVPPQPGHRACIGLIRTLMQASPPGEEIILLNDFIKTRFEKRVILCKGAACGDTSARCNRCSLRCRGEDGSKVSFTLGGCTAINELLGQKGKDKTKIQPSRDAYKEIWDYIDSHQPRTEDPRRLVIPRSFSVSEWAYFLSRIFAGLAIPVHVDNVRPSDLTDAQPDFNIDSCAPHIGAVGQFRRLAAEPHGMILALQIGSLPTEGKSRGLTCTTNQGGVAVASNLARTAHPEARLHLTYLDLDQLDANYICDQLYGRLEPIFRFYGIAPTATELVKIIQDALEARLQLRREVADLAADLAEEALQEGRQVALVTGREYILNPGIYDSHIQRLLRDKHVTAIPSYVLDMELDEDYGNIYWRNSHFIVTLLNAVAHRTLHKRLRHSRLSELFRRIEEDPAGPLLPVVQISTFGCGPDSITSHLVAEIMKQRPFLLIQSDAIIKELAHLENRVNTYAKQLEQGLHRKLHIGGEGPFEVHTLDKLSSQEPLNRENDVIYFPTLSDNRALTAVFRGAGYTCLDNYDDDTFDLQELVKDGRKVVGDAVCTPLASMYAELVRGVNEFVRRKKNNDPMVAGKKRLLFFDTQGTGPCRQGQYPNVHRLVYFQSTSGTQTDGGGAGACNALPGGGIFQFLIGNENQGYNAGFEEWVLLRCYQGAILQGVLHDLMFKGGISCRDYDEYQHFIADFRKLKMEIYRLLESYHGPGKTSRKILKLLGDNSRVATLLKYFLYRIHGREFKHPLKRFVSRWKIQQPLPDDLLRIWISGEGYMRVAQSENIFRSLLSTLGYKRFNLQVTPLMSFMEYLLDEAELNALATLETMEAAAKRESDSLSGRHETSSVKMQKDKLEMIKRLRYMLRHLLAAPLYKAARLQMPPASIEMIEASKALLPTLRPLGELAPYVGEALIELRHEVDLFLNVGPNGCMVSSMGEVLTPSIMQAKGIKSGRIQNLFSADGDVNQGLLTMAVLKAMGPERYYQIKSMPES